MVVLTKHRGEGFYAAKVIWAPAGSHYPAGGYDITVSPSDVYRARTLDITDPIAGNLIAEAKPNLIAGRIEAGKTFARTIHDIGTDKNQRQTFTIVAIRGSDVDAKQDSSDVTSTFPFGEVKKHILLDNFTSRFRGPSEAPA